MAKPDTSAHGIASLIVEINEEYLNKYGTKLIAETGEVGGVSREFRYDGRSKDVSDVDSRPVGIVSDGQTLILSGQGDDNLYQFSFGQQWDVSSLSYDNISFDVSAQDSRPSALTSDGETLLMSGTSNDSLYQYSMDNRWDLSTISFDNKVADIPGQEADGLVSDGSTLLIADDSDDIVKEYEFGAVWDLSTLSSTGVELDITVEGQTQNPGSLVADDTVLVVGDSGDGDLFQYEFGTAWDLSTAYFSGARYLGQNLEDDLDSADDMAAGDGVLIVAEDGDDVLYSHSYNQPFTVPHSN